MKTRKSVNYQKRTLVEWFEDSTLWQTVRALKRRSHGMPRPWFITAIIFMAFIVRIVYLEAPSIWVDEAMSRQWALMQPSAMIADLAFDHVPLYYLILEVWGKLAGLSVFSLRILSVFLGTLVVSEIYILGKKLFDEGTGLIASYIVSIVPFLVYYSRMARPYPLLWFFVLLTMNGYIKAFQTRTWSAWFLYALAAIAAAYTHFTALPIIGFLGVHALLQWKRLKPQLRQWIGAHFLFLLTFIPFINQFYRMVFNHTPTVVSRGHLSLWYLADIFVSWNLGHAFDTTKLAFILSVLSFGLLATIGAFSFPLRWSTIRSRFRIDIPLFSVLLQLRRRGAEMFLIGCSASLLILAILAKLINPDNLSFSPRNFSVAAVPYYFLLARGMQLLDPASVKRIAVIGVSVVMLIALGISVDQGAGVDWRWVAQHIQNNEQDNDVVLLIPAGQYLPALETYYDGESALKQQGGGSVDDYNFNESFSSITSYERVWLITINDAQFDPKDSMGGWFAARCTLCEEETLIPKHARMRLYGECD